MKEDTNFDTSIPSNNLMRTNLTSLQFNKDLDLMGAGDELSRWKNDDQSMDLDSHGHEIVKSTVNEEDK